MVFSNTDMPAQANRHSLDSLYTSKKVHLPVYVVYGSGIETTYSSRNILYCVCMGLFSIQKLRNPADTLMLAKASCVNIYFFKTVVGIQKTVILSFPLLLAGNALQKVW